MHAFVQDMLQCPVCAGPLQWSIGERGEGRIEQADIQCVGCGASYFVREGIGVFLPPDLPRNDLWEQTSTALGRYLHEHPDVEQRLMAAPPETLSPADRFYRALALEERGDFAQAKAVADSALPLLYTPEYLACHESQKRWVIDRIRHRPSPIVDLASGRGDLVERMARELRRPVVATDFSLRILRRNRRALQGQDFAEHISLLAMDARRTPFRDGAVSTLTTNLGLPNIEKPGELLAELRRVVSGEFLAITLFYPSDDEANLSVLREFGVAPLLVRESLAELLARAGWHVEIANAQTGRALPTPASELLEGARIDALPVAPTVLEWCTVCAR
ncbi:MAG: methyltransferase domain-containing protein [Anaerolineae bacterium]|nr:methyltransferase domain-containing protein [Anaerolineae bacterium]